MVQPHDAASAYWRADVWLSAFSARDDSRSFSVLTPEKSMPTELDDMNRLRVQAETRVYYMLLMRCPDCNSPRHQAYPTSCKHKFHSAFDGERMPTPEDRSRSVLWIGDPCPSCATGIIGQSQYNLRCANCGWLGARIDTISRPVMNPPADEAEAGNRANTAPLQADSPAERRGMAGPLSESEAAPVMPTRQITEEEAFFEVWFNLLRTKRWRAIRPDMGPTPSEGFMLGFKDNMRDGWMARASLHVTPSHRGEKQ